MKKLKNSPCLTDIHTHVLPFVDDGCPDMETALKMLEKEAEIGVKNLILTPHYRFNYKAEKERLLAIFNELKDKAKEKNVAVNLYLGQEIYANKKVKELILEQKLLTLNDGKFLLLEFDFSRETDIAETVYEFVRLGFKPIVAHIERYSYVDLGVAEEVKEVGGYIQVNAGSIAGKAKHKYGKIVKKLFKNSLVDFVASDYHSFRENVLDKAYRVVDKKYGQAVADAVFKLNAENIIQG